MSHRYESLLVHCVFSTKDREPLIPEPMKRKLWAYMGGIARTNKFKALAVGGMPDHVHVLLSLPATLLVAKAVQFDQGRIVEVVERSLTKTVVCVAGRLRRVH